MECVSCGRKKNCEAALYKFIGIAATSTYKTDWYQNIAKAKIFSHIYLHVQPKYLPL